MVGLPCRHPLSTPQGCHEANRHPKDAQSDTPSAKLWARTVLSTSHHPLGLIFFAPLVLRLLPCVRLFYLCYPVKRKETDPGKRVAPQKYVAARVPERRRRGERNSKTRSMSLSGWCSKRKVPCIALASNGLHTACYSNGPSHLLLPGSPTLSRTILCHGGVKFCDSGARLEKTLCR